MSYNKGMKCPTCKQVMKQVRREVSHNPNEGNKEYDRTVYQCIDDDTWVTTEVPKVVAG